MNFRSGPLHRQGFTLIELLVTIALIAILAAVAQPSLRDYLQRSRVSDAQSALMAARLQMEQVYQDRRTYASSTDTTQCAYIPPSSSYFSYSCTLGTGTYSMKASNLNAYGLGAAGSFVFTISETGAQTTMSWAGTAPNPIPACWWYANGRCR